MRHGRGKKVLPLPAFLRGPISRGSSKAFIVDTAAYFFRTGARRHSQAAERRAARAGAGDDRGAQPGHDRRVRGAGARGRSVNVVAARDARVAARHPGGAGLSRRQPLQAVPLPACVERWHNFADPLDPVALDKGLAGDFVAASGWHLPSPIVDELIVNGHTRERCAASIRIRPSATWRIPRCAKRLRRDAPSTRWRGSSSPATSRSAGRRRAPSGADRGARARLRRGGREHENEAEREKAGGRCWRSAASIAPPTEPASAGQDSAPGSRAHRRQTERSVEGRARSIRCGASSRRTSTPRELRMVAAAHRHFNVYAVWRSARSASCSTARARVLQADAALESYGAGGRASPGPCSTPASERTTRTSSDGSSRSRRSGTARKPGPPQRAARATRPRRPRHARRRHHRRRIDERQRQAIHGVAPEARSSSSTRCSTTAARARTRGSSRRSTTSPSRTRTTAALAIHGLNLSLGGPFDSTVYGCGFSPICQELRRLWRSGVLVVVASGNEGQLEVETPDGDIEINTPMSIGDPANLEDCIAVGSVNADRPHLYGVSAFSSRGPTSDGRCKPDVVAPGERISPATRASSRRADVATAGERHEHGGAACLGAAGGVPLGPAGIPRPARRSEEAAARHLHRHRPRSLAPGHGASRT